MLFSRYWGVLLQSTGMDVHLWTLCSSKGFFCKSLFLFLVNPSSSSGVFASLWKVKNSKTIKFFIWQISLRKVNTLDRVSRKLANLIGLQCCILYRRVVEYLDHIL